jgi:hypothetical protein
MAHQEAANTHIVVLHHIHLRHHLATFHITHSHHTLSNGIVCGQDQTQAIRQAVTTALTATVPTLHPSHLILWLPYTHTCERELTHLSSLSDTSAVHALIVSHLDMADYHTFDLCSFDRKWPGMPSQMKLWTMELE